MFPFQRTYISLYPVETQDTQRTTTLCISNGGQSTIYDTNMNKINGSAIIKVSGKNSATAHTLDRYPQARKK